MKPLITAVMLFTLIAMFGTDTWAQSSAPPIRMAYLQSDIHHLALWVALEKGLFKEKWCGGRS